MMLIEQTNVPDEALPVQAFKAHLRMGSGFGLDDDLQDEVLRSFLRAAMAAIEARTDKALLARTVGLTVSEWADPRAQALPVAPVLAVTRVATVTRAGDETDVSPQSYWLERDGHTPRLRPTGVSLPRVATGGAVRVEFTAGFGPAWTDVPSDMQQAVMMLAAHYYEYRHDTALSGGCMPFGVTSLIERFRVLRIGRGVAGQ